MAHHQHDTASAARRRDGGRPGLRPATAMSVGVVSLAVVLGGCSGGGSAPADGSSASAATSTSSSSSSSSAPSSVTVSPSSPSQTPSSTASPSADAGAQANAAVCAQLRRAAVGMQKGGPVKTPQELTQRVAKLAEQWNAAAAKSKDPQLRAPVRKAVSALKDIANSTAKGKKVSLAEVQDKLKTADAGLRQACPKPTAGK